MSYTFTLDQRLGIYIPELIKDWDDYTLVEQEQILAEWEAYRSDIPNRIKEIEKIIVSKLEELNQEDNFIRSCALNSDIAELASAINDLNIWFRIQQETEGRIHR